MAWFRPRTPTPGRGRRLWRLSPHDEVREDLAFHLAMLAREFEQQGLSPREAQAQAHARFGDFEQVARTCRGIARGRERDRRRAEWHRGLRHDVVAALRQVRRRPGFAVLAVVMMALAVGATSGIFSVVNGVLLTPLPYPAPGELVFVCQANQARASCGTVSPPDAVDLARESRTVGRIGLFRGWPFRLQHGNEAVGVTGGIATPDFFAVMATRPALGRLLVPDDQRGVGSPVAVVSHAFWRGQLGADTSIVGQVVRIDGTPVEIVGVLEAGFEAPFLEGVEVWRPLHIDPAADEHRDWKGFRAVGRLAPGATMAEAREELAALGQELARRHPDTNQGWVVRAESLHDRIVGSAESLLWLFLGAVAFVLLIACANVANLLLARSTQRRREMAVRAALGAGRGRLVRLVLIESFLLAMAGGIGGFGVALWATDLFLHVAPPGIPRLDEVALDGTVFAFALALTVVTSLLFGAAPAWHGAKVDLNDALKASGTSTGSGGARLRSPLVVVEVALALMLLVGAGLLTRSFGNLLAWDPGFEREHVLTVWTFLSPGDVPERDQLAPVYRQVQDELAALPGVVAVGRASAGPMFGGTETGEVEVAGRPVAPGDRPTVRWFDVGPGYFSVLGIPLVRGRDFLETDRRGAPRVAIVNETAAARLFGTESPIGRRFTMVEHGMSLEVVGVVADVPPLDPDAAVTPEVYWPFAQVPRWATYLVLRTDRDPELLGKTVADRLRDVVPAMQVSAPRPLPELIERHVVGPRFTMLLIGTFAFVALVLAAGGVFGVLAFTVATRTREIGIRMALGADRRRVVQLVVREGVVPALLGTAIGIAGALALGDFLASRLHGVTAQDVPTYASVAAGMLLVALLASWLPARRATRIDPVTTLRAD